MSIYRVEDIQHVRLNREAVTRLKLYELTEGDLGAGVRVYVRTGNVDGAIKREDTILNRLGLEGAQ